MDKTVKADQKKKHRRPSKANQRTTIVTSLLGGKIRLLRHNDNPMLYARSYIQGRYVSMRTMETSIRAASKVAEEWFYELKTRVRQGDQLHEPLFSDIVRDFLVDPSIQGGVSGGTHDNYEKKWNILEPLLRDVRVSAVTLDKLEEIRNIRATETNRYETPITANTIDKDISFIRQALRWGVERKSLPITVPPAPKRTGRFHVVKHGRPTFSLKQWRTVTLAARKRALAAEKKRAAQERTHRLAVVRSTSTKRGSCTTSLCLRVVERYALAKHIPYDGWIAPKQFSTPLAQTKMLSTCGCWGNIVAADNGRMDGC